MAPCDLILDDVDSCSGASVEFRNRQVYSILSSPALFPYFTSSHIVGVHFRHYYDSLGSLLLTMYRLQQTNFLSQWLRYSESLLYTCGPEILGTKEEALFAGISFGMLLSYIVSDHPGYVHVSAFSFVACDVHATVCVRILANRE